MEFDTPFVSKTSTDSGLISFERHQANNTLEREKVQKRTFTRWINSHISKVSDLHVNDLYCDLADGRVLKTLLEVLTGETLPPLNNDTMRIYCLENLHKILIFLEGYRVHIVNIQPLDIYNGNNHLILGLIWIIILSFQVCDIVDSGQHPVLYSADRKMSKSKASEELLRWCQLKTADYMNVNIMDFSTSWKDGLAFNAIIHRHRPDLIDYDQLRKYEPSNNLNNAFSVAQHYLGVEAILDSADLDVPMPDSCSIITYVSSLCRYFSEMKIESIHSKRLTSIVQDAVDVDMLIEKYRINAQELLKWINNTIQLYNDCPPSNDLEEMNLRMANFNDYKFNPRPKRMEQKNDLELLLLNIRNKKIRGDVYTLDDAESLAEIDRQWEILEKVENFYENTLKSMILNFRRMLLLETRFYESVERLEDWISLKIMELDSFDDQCSQMSVSFVLKKMELLNEEISSQGLENGVLENVVEMLVRNSSFPSSTVSERFVVYMAKWTELAGKYQESSQKLAEFRTVESLSIRIENLREDMDSVWPSLMSFSFSNEKQIDALIDDSATLSKEIDRFEDLQNEIKEDYDKIDNSIDKVAQLAGEITRLDEYLIKMKNIMASRDGKLAELQRNLKTVNKTVEFSNWVQQQLTTLSLMGDGNSVDEIETNINDLADFKLRYNNHVDEFMTEIKPYNTVTELTESLKQSGFSPMDSTCTMDECERVVENMEKSLMTRLDAYKVVEDISELSDVMETVILIYSDKISLDSDLATIELLINQHDGHFDKCSDYSSLLKSTRDIILQNDRDVDNMVETSLVKLQEMYANVQYLGDARKKRLSCAMAYNQIMNGLNSVSDWISHKKVNISSLDDEIDSIKSAKLSLDLITEETSRTRIKLNEFMDTIESCFASVEVEDTQYARNVRDLYDQVIEEWYDWLALLKKHKDSIEISYTKESINSSLSQVEENIAYYETFIQGDLENVDVSRLMSLRRVFNNFNSDVQSIKDKISSLRQEAENVWSYNRMFSEEVSENLDTLSSRLTNLIDNADEYQTKMQEANDVCRFLCRMDKWEIWLSQFVMTNNVHNQSGNDECKKHMDEIYYYSSLLESEKVEFNEMVESGREMLGRENNFDNNVMLANLNKLSSKFQYIEEKIKEKKTRAENSMLLKVFNKIQNDCELLLDKDETMLSIVIPNDFYDDIPSIIAELSEYVKERAEEPIQQTFDNLAVAASKLNSQEYQEQARDVQQRWNENTNRLAEKISNLKNFSNYVDFTDFYDDFFNSSSALLDKLKALGTAPIVNSDVNPALMYRSLVDSMQLQFYDIEQLNPTRLAEVLPEYEGEINQKMEDISRLKDEVCENFNMLTNPVKMSQSNIEESFYKFSASVDSSLGLNIQSGQHASLLLDKCDELASEGVVLQSALLGKSQSEEDAVLVEQKTSAYLSSVESYRSRISLTEQSLKFAAKAKYTTSLFDKMVEQAEMAVPMNLGEVEMQSVQLERLHGQMVENEPEVNQLKNEITEALSTNPSPTELMEINNDLDNKWNYLKSQLEDKSNQLKTFESFFNLCVEVRERLDWIELQSSFLTFEQSTGDDAFVCDWIQQMLSNRYAVVKNGVEEIDNLVEKSQNLEDHPYLTDLQRNQLKKERENLSEKYDELCDLMSKNEDYVSCLLKLNPFFYELAEFYFFLDQKTLFAQNMDVSGNFLRASREIENARDLCDRIRNVGARLLERCEKTLSQLDMSESEVMPSAPRGLSNAASKFEDLDEILTQRMHYCEDKMEYSRYYQHSQEIRDFLSEIARFVTRYLEMTRKGEESMVTAKLMYKRLYYFESLFSKATEKFSEFGKARGLIIDKYSVEERENLSRFYETTENDWKRLNALLEHGISQIDSDDLLLQFFGLHNSLWKWVGQMIDRTSSPLKEVLTFDDVELLVEENASLRRDITAYDEIFDKYIELGRAIVMKESPRSSEISQAVLMLTTRRGDLMQSLSDRDFMVELLCDVRTFAARARTAEDVYYAKKLFLSNSPLGRSFEEVERLLKRNDYFVESLKKYSKIVEAVKNLTKLELFEFSPTELLESVDVKNLSQQVAKGYAVELRSPRADSVSVEISVDVEDQEELKNGGVAYEQMTNGHGELETETEVPVEATKESVGIAVKLKRMVSSRVSRRLPPESVPPILGSSMESSSHYEGNLKRKMVWSTASKKAYRRNWVSLFAVLHNGSLYFYNSFTAAREKSEETFHSEPPLELAGCFCSMADDYVKHPFVFRLSNPDGAECLFQAESQEAADAWCDRLVDACGPTLEHSSAKVTRVSSKLMRQ